jgi:hypothetical protein
MPKEFLLKKCNEQVSEIEKLRAENVKLKERNKMLESQLTDKQSIAKMNGAGDGASRVLDKVDLTGWFTKIDAVYLTFKKAHEMCLTLQSKEKILNFRIKFKERYEEVKKVLVLDGSRLDNVSLLFSFFNCQQFVLFNLK